MHFIPAPPLERQVSIGRMAAELLEEFQRVGRP